MEAVNELRVLGRNLVRQLGVLEKNELPLSQCHVLVELEQQKGLSAKELCALLFVDKAALSRVIAQLCESELIRVIEDPTDLRRKPLALTAAGQRKVKDIHTSANQRVNAALKCLSAKQRQSVIEGLSLYVQALSRARDDVTK